MAIISEKKGADSRSAPSNLGQGLKKTYTMDVLNILDTVETVKSFFYQLFLNQLGDRIGESKVFRKLDGENFSFVPYSNKGCKQDCPFLMPLDYLHYNGKKTYRERKKPTDKYKSLFESASEGKISDEVLKNTVKFWAQNNPIICMPKEADYIMFEGFAKSTARYNKKSYWRIVDHAKACFKQGMKPYFLTMTIDPKKYKLNYYSAYIGANFQFNRILKNLSRAFNAEYEIVLESQKTGNPHAHAVLWLPDWNKDDKTVRKGKKEYISDGKLKKYLLKYEKDTGFMELRRGNEKKAVNYLCKYITKTTTADFMKISKDPNKLKTEDRKMLLSAIMPVLCGIRQFKVSQLKNISTENKPKTQKEALLSAEMSFDEVISSLVGKDEETARRVLAPYLNKSCNNLPLCPANKARVLSYSQFSRGSSVAIEDANKLPREKRRYFYENAKSCTCSGCILSDLLEADKPFEDFIYKDFPVLPEEQLTQARETRLETLELVRQALGDEAIVFEDPLNDVYMQNLNKSSLMFSPVKFPDCGLGVDSEYFEHQRYDIINIKPDYLHKILEDTRRCWAWCKEQQKKLVKSVKRCYNSKEKPKENNNPELFKEC